jgi:3-carboxy-cis,cis-muconate cycloisomerase
VSVVPWHSARDRFARLGAELAILAGVAGKIGRDVSLLMQLEVGEAAEPAKAGRGGSSSMAHKRNPVLSMLALEAAQRTPGLAGTLLAQLTPEHERGLGQWQSQWFTLRELLCATASGVAAMGDALEGLEVDEQAMQGNLASLLETPTTTNAFGSARAMIEHALGEWQAATSPGTAP